MTKIVCENCNTEAVNPVGQPYYVEDKKMWMIKVECNCGRYRTVVPYVDGDGNVYLTDQETA